MKNNGNIYPLPVIDPDIIDNNDCFILFESGKPNSVDHRSFVFSDPEEIILVSRYEDIPEAFDRIEKYSLDHYMAGYFSYELGYYFEEKFSPPPEISIPLVKMAVFPEAAVFDHYTGKTSSWNRLISEKKDVHRDYKTGTLKANITRDDYYSAVNVIKQHIEKGDIYQANFTFMNRFDFSGCPYTFYRDLLCGQPVAYSSFMKFSDEYILSLSPELFFRIKDNVIESKPMKGTIKRGLDTAEDKKQSLRLKTSSKDLAENTMIVDLIRNDIGKLSAYGSVTVPEMHTIEKYRTLFQMTSTVRGVLNDDISYTDIFKGIFPCGSVTGTPKIKAMQIIRELENENRGVYCGAMGMISPGRKAVFNVPIRTIRINGSQGEVGLGSGIVADSDHVSEYDECQLKSQFITNITPNSFKLIETMLWENEYIFSDEHLRRLKDSAEYFEFNCHVEELRKMLTRQEGTFQAGKKYRIRITLDENGMFDIDTVEIIPEINRKKQVVISDKQTDPEDVFLYHKTTNRLLYDREYEKYSNEFYDVIFFNNKGELTEGAISNIIIKRNGVFLTPELSCGLLNGIYRQYFIDNNNVIEAKINREMLLSSDEIFLCNSVRGIRKVELSI